MSNFIEGQDVICVNDDFPLFKTTNDDKSQIGHNPTYPTPKKGEILKISEILGEFLRFDKYDDNNPNSPHYGFNWWNESNFRPIQHTGEQQFAHRKIEIQ